MIAPALKDEAFLDDVQAAGSDAESLHVWWLGQSGFLLQHAGRRLILDPYLSDSLTKKYASTDKPHVRISERVIDPSRLAGIDGVTSSHNHTDHLDAETLLPLRQANPALSLIIPEANRSFVAQRLGTPAEWPLGLDHGQSVAVGPFTVEGVAAAHEALETDVHGRHVFLGFVVRVGPWTIYHSGDTVRYPGMEAPLRSARIDLALLPINGRSPQRRVAGNLWGREAAQLASDIQACCVVPCHYDLFEFNTASPADFVHECRALDVPHHVPRLGERLSLRMPQAG